MELKERLQQRDRIRKMAKSILAHLEHDGPVKGFDSMRYDPESQKLIIDVTTLQRCMLTDFIINGRTVIVCIADEKETL